MSQTRPATLRRWFGTLCRLVDDSRRVTVNLLFLAIVGALAFAAYKRMPPSLHDKTALVLDLAGPLVEQRGGGVRDSMITLSRGASAGQVQLRDVLRALDAAAADPKIGSVLLLLDDFAGAGLPNLREMAAALDRFRKASGKQVIAWGSRYDQRQYFVAAHADEVLLHPMGMVYLEGYGRLRNYYRDALDRLGVTANVIRVGKYKNFGEPYFANAPSPETIEADKSVYDALWAAYTGEVERARKLPAGAIARGIDELPQRMTASGGDSAKLALQARLVDGLKTRDEMRALMIERGVRDDDAKTFAQVNLSGYLARLKTRTSGDAVGVVIAEGEISDGDAPPGAVGGRSTAELIRKAREDERILAIVLRVSSPGGSAFGAELIRRELELTRAAGKPVVVSMGDVAASGGYWISMAADEVIADPTTLTGSIGVFALLPSAEGLMAKLLLHTGGYSTTWLANAYDPRTGLDPRFAALVQAGVGHIYADFTTKAARSRKTTPEKIDAVAQGRVWTGAQALERGLVDRTGSFGDALAAARRRAKLGPDDRVAYLEREPGRIERLLGLLRLASIADERVWLQPIGPALLPAAAAPALARELHHELGWLAELTEQRQPFTAVVHCLCTAP